MLTSTLPLGYSDCSCHQTYAAWLKLKRAQQPALSAVMSELLLLFVTATMITVATEQILLVLAVASACETCKVQQLCHQYRNTTNLPKQQSCTACDERLAAFKLLDARCSCCHDIRQA